MRNAILISLILVTSAWSQNDQERIAEANAVLARDYARSVDFEVAEMQRQMVAQKLELQQLLEQFGKSHPQVKAVENQIKAIQVMLRRMQAASVEASQNRAKSLLDALTSELSQNVKSMDRSKRKAVEDAVAVIRDAIRSSAQSENRIKVTKITSEEQRRLAEMQQAIMRTRARMLQDQQKLEEEMVRIRLFEKQARERFNQASAKLKKDKAETDSTNSLSKRVDSIETSID
ncbi:MAG: hypothetical protein AAF497_00950, partial [Planctomycetota bacterium]